MQARNENRKCHGLAPWIVTLLTDDRPGPLIVRLERVLAGQAVARAAGKKWGGRKKGTRVKLTDEQSETVQKMHKEGRRMAQDTGEIATT